VCTVYTKKIALNGEVLCELTNAKADFDPTCPSYEYDRAEERESDAYSSAWSVMEIFWTIIKIIAFILGLYMI
jgi:hypothetical protein